MTAVWKVGDEDYFADNPPVSYTKGVIVGAIIMIMLLLTPTQIIEVEVYRVYGTDEKVYISSSGSVYYTLDGSDPKESSSKKKYLTGDIISIKEGEVLLIRSKDLSTWGDMQIVRGNELYQYESIKTEKTRHEIGLLSEGELLRMKIKDQSIYSIFDTVSADED